MFVLMIPLLLIYFGGGVLICSMGARWASKRFGSRWAALGGFTLLFALIFGNEIYGYTHWQYLCKEEGGVRAYKKVPVEGFLIEGKSVGSGTVREYLKFGYSNRRGRVYKFIEGEEDGVLYKYFAGPGDEFDIRREVVEKPFSNYAVSSALIEKRSPYIWSVERSVYDIYSRDRIGVARYFGYRGAAVISFFRAITGSDQEGSASYCGRTEDFFDSVIPSIQ